jgi:hypothetical protein
MIMIQQQSHKKKNIKTQNVVVRVEIIGPPNAPTGCSRDQQRQMDRTVEKKKKQVVTLLPALVLSLRLFPT